jgi:hypothetical protein
MKVIRLKFVYFRSLLLAASPPLHRVAFSPPCSLRPCRRRRRRRGRSDQQGRNGRWETKARTPTTRTWKTPGRAMMPAVGMTRPPRHDRRRSLLSRQQVAHRHRHRQARRLPEWLKNHQPNRRRGPKSHQPNPRRRPKSHQPNPRRRPKRSSLPRNPRLNQ